MALEIDTATDYQDMLDRTVLFAGGYPVVGTIVPGANTGNGTLEDVVGSPLSRRETWTITATSPTAFSVTGSESGLQATAATAGVPYTSDDGRISFKLAVGSIAFIAADSFVVPFTAGVAAQGRLNDGDPVADPGNTGDGTMNDHGGTGIPFAEPQAVDEFWTFTAVNATTFDVLGSVSGANAQLTVGVDYTTDAGEIEVRITAGGTPFVAADFFTFTVVQGRPWLVERNGFIDATHPAGQLLDFGQFGQFGSPTYLTESEQVVWRAVMELVVDDGGSSYVGTGDGTLTGFVANPGVGGRADIWRIIAVNATTFNVLGAQAGSQATQATVGVPYTSDDGRISFLITAGGTPFVALDEFAFRVHGFSMRLEDNGDFTIAWDPTTNSPATDFAGPIAFTSLEAYRKGAPHARRLLSLFGANSATSTSNVPVGFNEEHIFLENGTYPIRVRGHSNEGVGLEVGLRWREPVNNAAGAMVAAQNIPLLTAGSGLQNFSAVTWHVYNNVDFAHPINEATMEKLFNEEGFHPHGGNFLASRGVHPVLGVRAVANFGRARDVIFKGFGNAGQDEFWMGIRAIENPAIDYWNWQLTGFSAFNPTLPLDGPNIHQPLSIEADDRRQPYIALWDQAITYWMTFTGRRLIITQKVSTIFATMYQGMFLPYATPIQYPQPLAVCGTLSFENEGGELKFTNITDRHRHLADPGSEFGNNTIDTTMMIREPTGLWRGYQHVSTSTGGARKTNTLRGIYPNHEAFSRGQVREGPGGEFMIEPLLPTNDGTDEAVYGEFDGVFWVSGFSNAAEDTLLIEGKSYLSVPNIFRIANADFIALLLE